VKLISFNVNGIRAIVKKDFFSDLEKLDPDILCIQETKAQDDQVQEALANLEGYHIYSNSAVKKGYSGTAILTKKEPISIRKDIGIEAHDQEGRVICAEYDGFFLVNVYVPNAKNDLSRLDDRKEWDLKFYEYLKDLEKEKAVIVCGDFNVAHKEIDLARPKQNYDKSAGFTQVEIDGMDRFTSGGFVDSFRHFYPDQADIYTWWSFRAGARARNVGWRIDYFLVSELFMPRIKHASIHNEIKGSDHCPVSLELH
jgi:exodeoxyribonuclease-3